MSTIDKQQQYWDSVSKEKEFTTPFRIDEFEKFVSKDMSILDVGCGYGRNLNELHERGFTNLEGVDFSQGMIDRGRKLYPHLNLQKNSPGFLPYADSTFDSVLLIAVLTCIVRDDDQEFFVSEIERVLTDNGVLYINDFLINKDSRNRERYERYKEKYGVYGIFELPGGAVVRHYTREHQQDITKNFRELNFTSTVYTTMNGNKSKGFYYLGRKN